MKIPILNGETYAENKRLLFMLGNSATMYGLLRTGRDYNLAIARRMAEAVGSLLPIKMDLPENLNDLAVNVENTVSTGAKEKTISVAEWARSKTPWGALRKAIEKAEREKK